MKPLLIVLAGLPLAAPAATVTVVENYVVATLVPDNTSVGLADSRVVSTFIDRIVGLEVTLTLSGGWNGDFYAYLAHAGGIAVLLNRPGRTLAEPEGAGSRGLEVVFADGAAADIHTAIPGSGGVAGVFQPDARTADPAVVVDTDPRTAFLAAFDGVDPNGEWTLFIADLSPGDTGTLESWSLRITGIPEPSVAALTAVALTCACRRRRRQIP